MSILHFILEGRGKRDYEDKKHAAWMRRNYARIDRLNGLERSDSRGLSLGYFLAVLSVVLIGPFIGFAFLGFMVNWYLGILLSLLAVIALITGIVKMFRY